MYCGRLRETARSHSHFVIVPFCRKTIRPACIQKHPDTEVEQPPSLACPQHVQPLTLIEVRPSPLARQIVIVRREGTDT
jgi:hypothetical protein